MNIITLLAVIIPGTYGQYQHTVAETLAESGARYLGRAHSEL